MFSHSKSKVYFFFQQKGVPLRNRAYLKKFIQGIFRKEGKVLDQLSYIFCSDEHLKSINKKYLDHSYYTDIITFDFSDNKDFIYADAYLSIDRIRDNAQNLEIPLYVEIRRVLFHGALHLCGYNDKNKKEKLTIRKKEEFYLSRFKNNQPRG